MLLIGATVGLPVTNTEKSDHTPVEAPLPSDTETVQVIELPARKGLGAVQLRLDAVVGMP